MAPKSTKAPGRGKLEKKLAASETRVEQLTAEVAQLASRLRELEIEARSWRKKAEKQRSRVHKVRAKAELAIAEATALAKKRAKAKANARIRQVIADHPCGPRAEPLALRGAPELPEPSWTVTRLRAAAREQGIAGCNHMRKDQLLDVLI